MLSKKEINKRVESILGEPKLYDFRCELRIMDQYLSFEEAHAKLTYVPEDERHLYSITSSYPDNYTDDLSLATSAAKRVADKNECTFVLSLEDGSWKASFGDYGDCAEYVGGNPAYATCVSMLKFMGKL